MDVKATKAVVAGKAAACSVALALVVGCAVAAAPAEAHAAGLAAAQGAGIQAHSQERDLSPQSFTVVTTPSAPKIDSCVAAGPGKVAVHASSVSGAQGYEFQIARNASFTKGLKKKKVRAYGATFGGLGKGKKYYVRARAYQTSTNVCTKWSSKKSTKAGISRKASKIVGAWKLVRTSSASYNSYLNRAKKLYPGKSMRVTFKKSGRIMSRGFTGSTRKLGSTWSATGKRKGVEVYSNKKVGSLSVKGKTLKAKESGVTMTFRRA